MAERPVRGIGRQILRGAGLVCSMLIGLAACSTPGGMGYDEFLGPQHVKHARIDNLYGNYLAAQEAARLRDNSAAANYYAGALKKDPGNPLLLERAFLFEVSSGNEAEANALATEVIRRRSGNRLAQLTLAVTEIKRGRFSNAEDHLASSARGVYNGLAIDLIKAWAKGADGKFVEANKILSGINALGNEEIFKAYHLALMHNIHGSPKAAEENFKAALDVTGNSAIRVVDAYGRFLERGDRAAEAIVLYNSFLAGFPDHPLIARSLARAKVGGKKPDHLVKTTQEGVGEALHGVAGLLARDRNVNLPVLYLQIALWANPDLVQARLLQGELYWQSAQFDKVAQTMANIPPDDAFAPDAAVQIALSLERLGRPKDAERVLRRAIRQHPGDVAATIALGDILRANENYELAVNAYDRAFEIVGDEKANWFLYYSRGASLEQAGFWVEAEKDLMAALERAPDQPTILNHLGYSWVDRGLRLNEGLQLVQTAVDLSPGNGFIVDSLGWAYYQLGDYETAVKHLERALELEPEDPTLHEHLGDAYWQVGRKREANFQWQHSLDRNPTNDRAVKVKAKLVDGLGEKAPTG
jgi:tetratricopeptide (TPR) repeat protein